MVLLLAEPRLSALVAVLVCLLCAPLVGKHQFFVLKVKEFTLMPNYELPVLGSVYVVLHSSRQICTTLYGISLNSCLTMANSIVKFTAALSVIFAVLNLLGPLVQSFYRLEYADNTLLQCQGRLSPISRMVN